MSGSRKLNLEELMTGTILSKGTVVVTEGNVRRPRVTFTHPDGEEWDGHGEMPDWVREALDEKWLLERYEVSEAEDDEEESFGWGDTTPFDDDADEDDWEDDEDEDDDCEEEDAEEYLPPQARERVERIEALERQMKNLSVMAGLLSCSSLAKKTKSPGTKAAERNPSAPVVLYGPDGQRWQPPGWAPQWFNDCVNRGMKTDELKIPGAAAKRFPPRFVSPAGELWSGLGEAPEWLLREIDNGREPEAFVIWTPDYDVEEHRRLLKQAEERVEITRKALASPLRKTLHGPDGQVWIAVGPVPQWVNDCIDGGMTFGGLRSATAAKEKFPTRFVSRHGQCWSGLGEPPDWLMREVNNGRDPGDFALNLSGSRPGKDWFLRKVSEAVAEKTRKAGLASGPVLHGPDGDKWNSVGPMPQWVSDCLSFGMTPLELRKTRAAKKRFPPLYRGSRRETWSGLGEVPGWVVDQIFQGRLIDDFLVRTDDGPELHRLIEKAGESIDAGVARFEEESRHSRRPTPAPQKRREWRVVAAYSPKSAPSSRPVFHGPDGQKWDGEDPKPQWVEECLACGMPLEALKNPEAVRKKFPTRFMSRIGERWSGVGEVPEWLVQEVENGEVPDAFAVWPPEENCPELRELIEKVWKGAAAAKPKAAPQPDAGRRPLKLEPGHLLDADLMAGGPFARLFSPEPQRLPPKYFGPQGEEWSGRGRRPGWVAASLADGATVKDLTEPGAARDILLAHRPRTGSHWERIAPDSDWKMVGPKGQIWKGWGPEPEWVEYALEQGWTREELTNPDWVDPDPVRPKDIVWDRYLGPNGEEWSGRGRQPRWLVEQIIQGRTQEEFLNPKYLGEQESVERNAAPSELMAEPVEPPPRFVGPMGEEWSGCGLRPRWLEEKLEEGWSLDDFRNPEYEDDAAEAPEENDRDVAEDIEDVNAVEDIEPAEAAEEAAEDEPGSSDPGETPVVPSSTARFLGPDGQEWSGRGRRPRWIMEALEAGRSMDDFRNPAYREEAGEDAEAPEDIDVAQKEAPEAELAEETGTPGDLPPPKYLGPNGERWEGRGPQPRWLVDLLFKGRHMKDFLNPAWREPGKPVYVGPGWAKYAGPHGEAWSGFGRCPRWLKELTASGGSREDFRNPQYGKEDLSPAKYLGPNGERWDGRGKYPKWALEARKQGHWLREFRNPAFDEANGITQQDPVRAAERGVKYLGPDGQEWNGRGRVPQWFMQLLRDGWAEGDLLVR